MTHVLLGGYYTESDAKKIKEKTEGKTYMNFIVETSNEAGNYKIMVSTIRANTSEEELKEMFYYYILTNL